MWLPLKEKKIIEANPEKIQKFKLAEEQLKASIRKTFNDLKENIATMVEQIRKLSQEVEILKNRNCRTQNYNMKSENILGGFNRRLEAKI